MKNLYNPHIDILVEKFKSTSRQALIKFAIQRHHKKYLFKKTNDNIENFFDFINSFIVDNFKFDSLENRWSVITKDQAINQMLSFLSDDLDGYEYWEFKNSEELCELFINEFSGEVKFFSNSERGMHRATVAPADPKPYWQNGIIVVDKEKIGGLWVSMIG